LPPHCVRKTEGAKFYAGLNIPEGAEIISKAVTRDGEKALKEMVEKGARLITTDMLT
jgi:urease gamma subunit